MDLAQEWRDPEGSHAVCSRMVSLLILLPPGFCPHSFSFHTAAFLKLKKKNVVTGKLTSAVTNRMTSTSKRNFSASSGRNPGKDLDTLCALWRSESLPLASISIWRTRGTVRMQTRHGASPKEEILVSTYVCCLLYNFDSSHFGE